MQHGVEVMVLAASLMHNCAGFAAQICALLVAGDGRWCMLVASMLKLRQLLGARNMPSNTRRLLLQQMPPSATHVTRELVLWLSLKGVRAVMCAAQLSKCFCQRVERCISTVYLPGGRHGHAV